MKFIQPCIAAIVFSYFIAICYSCYHGKPDQYVTYPALPAKEQPGYDKADVKALKDFVQFQIKTYAYVETYQGHLGNMLDAKPEVK